MRKPIHTVREDETIVAAAARMRDADVGFLPVLDANDQLVGQITERLITRRFVANELAQETRVAAVMDRAVLTCRARDELFNAQRIMRERHARRLVCVDDAGTPVGVLTLTDVAQNEDGFRLAKTVRQATDHKRRFEP